MTAGSRKAGEFLSRAVAVFLLSCACPALAVECGTGGMCQCPNEWRCLAPHATCAEACGLSVGGGSAAASPSGGFTPQQQLLLKGVQLLFQGSNRNDSQAKEASERAEAERRRRAHEEEERGKEESKNRLLGEMLGVDAAPDSPGGEQGLSPLGAASEEGGSLRLMADGEAAKKAPEKPDPRFKIPAFSKGFEAAGQCGSQNAGPYCAGAAAEQQKSCAADYHDGYALGEKDQKALLERAAKKGADAAAGGVQNNAASDPDAQGGCRTQWVQAYNRGYGSRAPRTKN